MRPWIRNVLWIAAIIASGATGWHYGVGTGTWVISSLSASNSAYDAFSDARRALAMLEGPSKGADRDAHRVNLQVSMSRLGGATMSLTYWRCNERQREIIASAERHLRGSPEPHEVFSAQIKMAYALCDACELPLNYNDFYSEAADTDQPDQTPRGPEASVAD